MEREEILRKEERSKERKGSSLTSYTVSKHISHSNSKTEREIWRGGIGEDLQKQTNHICFHSFLVTQLFSSTLLNDPKCEVTVCQYNSLRLSPWSHGHK